MRRDFTPYVEDLEYLEDREAPWEAVREGNACWYILHGYLPPEGYTPNSVSAAFCLPGTYPSTQIDMIYFHPHLTRLDGKTPNRLTNRRFDGKDWQQWSRHRLSPNDWQDGVDYLSTHIHYIEMVLRGEVDEPAMI